jgi:hypothetical protein
MSSIGVPELLIVLVMAVMWVLPVAAAVWVILTLNRLSSGQQAIQAKLDAIERLLKPV